MSCNCKRNNTDTRQQARAKSLIAGSVPTVSLDILKTRREICRVCPHSTKNMNPKYQQFGGLTNLSKCTKSNRILIECLKDPKYSCPEKKF